MLRGDKLTAVALLSIENELIYLLDINNIIDNFAGAKSQKKAISDGNIVINIDMYRYFWISKVPKNIYISINMEIERTTEASGRLNFYFLEIGRKTMKK